MNFSEISEVFAELDPPIWLVTAANENRLGGFIATTVMQASIVFEMPRLLITVAKRHNTYPLIAASGAFAAHLIDETQLDLVWRFGLQSGRDANKFSGLSFGTGSSGIPLLPGAIAWLDCRIEAVLNSGDRSIFLAAVVDGHVERTEKPLSANRLFALAPPEKRKIMDEQYESDGRLDAAAIQKWRDAKPADGPP